MRALQILSANFGLVRLQPRPSPCARQVHRQYFVQAGKRRNHSQITVSASMKFLPIVFSATRAG